MSMNRLERVGVALATTGAVLLGNTACGSAERPTTECFTVPISATGANNTRLAGLIALQKYMGVTEAGLSKFTGLNQASHEIDTELEKQHTERHEQVSTPNANDVLGFELYFKDVIDPNAGGTIAAFIAGTRAYGSEFAAAKAGDSANEVLQVTCTKQPKTVGKLTLEATASK